MHCIAVQCAVGRPNQLGVPATMYGAFVFGICICICIVRFTNRICSDHLLLLVGRVVLVEEQRLSLCVHLCVPGRRLGPLRQALEEGGEVVSLANRICEVCKSYVRCANRICVTSVTMSEQEFSKLCRQAHLQCSAVQRSTVWGGVKHLILNVGLNNCLQPVEQFISCEKGPNFERFGAIS